MGGGRFSFHFPFHLSIHRRAREGGEPLFLNQTGKTVQRPGLVPVTRERGVSGVQRSGFGQGPGEGAEMEAEGGCQRQTQGGASWCCASQVRYKGRGGLRDSSVPQNSHGSKAQAPSAA